MHFLKLIYANDIYFFIYSASIQTGLLLQVSNNYMLCWLRLQVSKNYMLHWLRLSIDDWICLLISKISVLQIRRSNKDSLGIIIHIFS